MSVSFRTAGEILSIGSGAIMRDILKSILFVVMTVMIALVLQAQAGVLDSADAASAPSPSADAISP